MYSCTNMNSIKEEFQKVKSIKDLKFAQEDSGNSKVLTGARKTLPFKKRISMLENEIRRPGSLDTNAMSITVNKEITNVDTGYVRNSFNARQESSASNSTRYNISIDKLETMPRYTKAVNTDNQITKTQFPSLESTYGKRMSCPNKVNSLENDSDFYRNSLCRKRDFQNVFTEGVLFKNVSQPVTKENVINNFANNNYQSLNNADRAFLKVNERNKVRVAMNATNETVYAQKNPSTSRKLNANRYVYTYGKEQVKQLNNVACMDKENKYPGIAPKIKCPANYLHHGNEAPNVEYGPSNNRGRFSGFVIKHNTEQQNCRYRTLPNAPRVGGVPNSNLQTPRVLQLPDSNARNAREARPVLCERSLNCNARNTGIAAFSHSPAIYKQKSGERVCEEVLKCGRRNAAIATSSPGLRCAASIAQNDALRQIPTTRNISCTPNTTPNSRFPHHVNCQNLIKQAKIDNLGPKNFRILFPKQVNQMKKRNTTTVGASTSCPIKAPSATAGSKKLDINGQKEVKLFKVSNFGIENPASNTKQQVKSRSHSNTATNSAVKTTDQLMFKIPETDRSSTATSKHLTEEKRTGKTTSSPPALGNANQKKKPQNSGASINAEPAKDIFTRIYELLKSVHDTLSTDFECPEELEPALPIWKSELKECIISAEKLASEYKRVKK